MTYYTKEINKLVKMLREEIEFKTELSKQVESIEDYYVLQGELRVMKRILEHLEDRFDYIIAY